MLNKLVNSIEFSLALSKRDTEAIVKATLQNLVYLLPGEAESLPDDEPEDIVYAQGWNDYHEVLLANIKAALNEHR